MTDMKSIRFPDPAADDMVRAILEDRKTVTRRVVKFRHGFNPYWSGYVPDGVVLYGNNNVPAAKAPYRPGDILYVRETWVRSMAGTYLYRATDTPLILDGWCPSIHMPREAARIFLRVTKVKVQRVQDITDSGIFAEGIRQGGWPPHGTLQWRHAQRADYVKLWDKLYVKPQPVKVKGVITHYESYPWEDIQETRTYRGKPRYVIGNPWVWVIEFERCEKPEGD